MWQGAVRLTTHDPAEKAARYISPKPVARAEERRDPSVDGHEK